MDRRNPEVTTAIILETRVRNSDDTHPVKLRITHQRKRKYYSLKGEHYKLDEFKNIVKPDSRGKNKEKRKKLESVENRAIEIIDNVLNEFSFEAFEKEYLNHKKKDATVSSYFEEKVKELDLENKIQTATLYRVTLRSLEKFDSKITFQKITPAYLEKYQKWMISGDHSYTTIGIYMRNLKHIVNRAIGDRVIHEYPFGDPKKGKYQIPEGKNTKKTLTISEIEKLFNYKPSGRNEYLALNYWLFSYLCNGMNMVDVANLKFKNIKGNNIEFIRQKTRDTTKEVPIIKVLLLPEVQQIIDDLGNEDKSPEN
jgi:integrase/recombinase XerD